MSLTARTVLRTVLDAQLPAIADAPRDGWFHYLTSMSDDGVGTFAYDHPSGWTLTIACRGGAYSVAGFTRPTFGI